MTRTIAITGATGFIGGILAKGLTASGWSVRALVRPGSNHVWLQDFGVELILGSLEDEQSLHELLGGVDAVVHCAGAVRGASQHDFDRINSDGVERLANIASQLQCPPYFILISSLAAREPELSYYAASKLKGERILQARAGNMNWDVIRPPAVYGPGDKEMLPLFQWMFKGVAPLIGSNENRVSLVHVKDLIDAVVYLLEQEEHRQQIYELHDGYPGGYSWQDIINVVKRLSGRSIFNLRIPVSFVYLIAAINIALSKVFGSKPMLSPGKVRELTHPSWVADNSKISMDTGWNPKITLEEGLRQLFGL